MTSRSCAAEMSRPPAADISTTATILADVARECGIDEQQKRERGENQDADLRDAG